MRYKTPRKFKGSLRYTVETYDDILRRVDKSGTCWLWTGAKNDKGYGQVQYNGKRHYVHRLVYSFVNGPIPDQVCHSCDNPLCCNPDHLWNGSQKDNMQDASSKGRIRNQWSEL